MLLLACSALQAARQDYHFSRVGGSEGLLQRTIQAVVQDEQGFVWIATQAGLQRYDGQRFLPVGNDPDRPGALPESFITALALDTTGRLWIGSNSHYLSALQLSSGRVDGAPTRGDPQRDRVIAVLAAADGSLWVGTGSGIERFQPATGQRTEVLRLTSAPRADRRGMPRAIQLALDGEGRLLAATDGGLYRVDPATLRSERIGRASVAQSVHRDAAGRIWIGTPDGMLQLGDGDILRRVALANGEPMPAVRRITSDASGRLWLALDEGGLLRFNPDDGSSLRLQSRPNVPGSLHDPQIAALMVDRGGLLWVGGESLGLATTPVEGARFGLLMDPPTPGPRPPSNNVRALLDAGGGRIWVGTTSGSLKRMDVASGASEEFIDVLGAALGNAVAAAPPVRVLGLAGGDRAELLWVGTDLGLFQLDADRRSARAVAPPRSIASADEGEVAFRNLLRARDGTLWISTNSSGLLAYRSASDEWRRYGASDEDEVGALGSSAILSLFEDTRGRLWIGTLDGLHLLDPVTGVSRRFSHDTSDASSLSANLVRAVVQAGDGRIWVASHGGLDLVIEDEATGALRFQRHGVAQGLPSPTVYGVLEDASGLLWTSSNLGITRFDPGSGRAQQFGMADGLQDLEFNGGAQLALDDGRLLFGGINGVNIFDPARIALDERQPPVVLTSLQVGSDGTERHFLDSRSPIEIQQVARVLRVRFAVLDFFDPARNRVQYRLEGFDSDWVERGALSEATYTNLDPGDYVLRARGSTAHGDWSEHTLSVPLRVVPTWWNSRTAKLLYALVGLLILALVWRVQDRRRRQESALLRQIAEREERLKLALWGSGDEFWDWDILANVVHRIGADQLLGRAREEDISTDEWRARAVHPEDLGRVQALLQAHITGQTAAFESEHRVRNADGDWVWVRSRGKVVERDAQGNALRIAGTARDITDSRRAERERRVASEVLSSMTEAVAVVDLDFRFVSVNPAFSRITGYSEDEVIGEPSSLLDSSQQAGDFYRQLREAAERLGHWKGEIWQRRKKGDEFLGWIELSEVRDNLGERTHFVAVVADITDQKRAELELRYLANYDTLTGLPNRTLLSERLARAVVRARRAATRVAVLFLDLDRFKDINDSMGHAAGDRILKAAAARLQETVREVDTVARLGGDEFTVVLEDLPDGAAAEHMATRIVEAFALPLEIEGRAETSISPSIGIALYPDHATTPTDLLKFADTAMYQAKDRGRNTWQTYTEAMDAETRRRASMMAALRKALDRGEFSLLFQPKLSLLDDRITGVEALLRWNSDELGPVSPATFIPLAEETGLIVPIGEWVLREAAMTLARWRRAGFDELVMAINISVLQLLRGHLPEHVAAVLEESGVPANRIELEVTESMVMANAEQAIRAMRELKGLGVSLAIDDFGTGYSSLIYLKRLPIDTLKIDKAFVGDLTTDPDDEAITATIITMAHSLGLNVVAEGAESADQIEYLREQGCDEIQGYWLSWPLDDARCLEFIGSWSPERARAGASGVRLS